MSDLQSLCQMLCIQYFLRVVSLLLLFSDLIIGWDGGYVVPVTSRSDYWYTSNQTPLQQAARGNHVGIIDLIMNGPSKSLDAGTEQVVSPDAQSLKASWSIDVDHSKARTEFGDDSETIKMTPLAIAIMFGNLEAARALLKHGARPDLIGRRHGDARTTLMRGVMGHCAARRFRAFILAQVRLMANNRAAEAFLAKYESLANADDDENDKSVNASDLETAERWYDDDWDAAQVPEGDMYVEGVFGDDLDGSNPGSADSCDDADVASTGGSTDFYRNIMAIANAVSPSKTLTRNAQIAMNNFIKVFTDQVASTLTSRDSSLTGNGVVEVVAALIGADTELAKYCKQEMEKQANSPEQEALHANLMAYLAQRYPDLLNGSESTPVTAAGSISELRLEQPVATGLAPHATHGTSDDDDDMVAAPMSGGNRATWGLTKAVDYLVAEVLELATHCCIDEHRTAINPSHITRAIKVDPELEGAFGSYVWGDSLVLHTDATSKLSCALLEVFARGDVRGTVKTDEFTEQIYQTAVSKLSNLSGFEIDSAQLGGMVWLT
jgi:ankyrin repeat protein